MVVISLKKHDQFLFKYRTPGTTNVGELTTALTELNNLRLRVLRLASSCDELVKHGPWKHPNEHGLSEEQIASLSDKTADAEDEGKLEPVREVMRRSDGTEFAFHPDPTGRRVGEAPTEDYAQVLRAAIAESRAALDKVAASLYSCLTTEEGGTGNARANGGVCADAAGQAPRRRHDCLSHGPAGVGPHSGMPRRDRGLESECRGQRSAGANPGDIVVDWEATPP